MKKLKKLLQNKTALQTGYAFFSQVFGLLVSFLVVIVVTNEMGEIRFGDYSFVLAIITFYSIFFEFGLLSSLSKMMAQNTNYNKEKELLGLSVFMVALISIAFIVFTFISSIFIQYFFEGNTGLLLQKTALFTWAFCLPFFLQQILKGVNKIEQLSVLFMLNKILSSALLLLLIYWQKLSIENAIIAVSISNIFTFLIFIVRTKPNFRNITKHWDSLKQDVKDYGSKKYFSKIIETSTFHTDKLMIGFFSSNVLVGFYNSAMTFANPIGIFGNALSNSKFKDFANKQAIKSKLIKTNLIFTLVAIIGANILGFLVVYFYWGENFLPVTYILPILSIAVGLNALYQPYANWIASNGFGDFIKQKSIYSAFTNILLNLMFIPLWGAIGAGIASLIAEAISYLLNVYYYKKGLKCVDL